MTTKQLMICCLQVTEAIFIYFFRKKNGIAGLVTEIVIGLIQRYAEKQQERFFRTNVRTSCL